MRRNAPKASFMQAITTSLPIDSESPAKKKKQEQYSRERVDEDINICLNCDKAQEKCHGICNKIRESRRKISQERKEGMKTDD